jgi:rhodanese-related sulfurtransferase
MKKIVLGFGFILNSSFLLQAQTTVNAASFQQQMKTTGAQILDVRTPGEYQSGHIEKALLANWNDNAEFERRIGFLDKKKPVYIYCLAGGRSHAAAARLNELGFEQIVELQGGVNAWKAANLPLEGKSNKPKMSLQTFESSIAHGTVLVDVGADWCPPCKVLEPVLARVQEKAGNQFAFVKVDGGNDDEVLQHFKITQLPVLLVFKNGQLSWRKDGIATEAEIMAQVKP